jgi:hypothetical protein
MSKKDRGARRAARKLESEVLSLQAQLKAAQNNAASLASRLDAAMRANARLSLIELRATVLRQGTEHLEVRISVTDLMAREIFLEKAHWCQMIGEKIAWEIDMSMRKRRNIESPFYGEQR